ncbi:hypothetical protein INH39_04000 [Massilia violaceinigra]|uniref:Uncharacterized protein n=1 Tax=Massilia violaceinigra TaxID=2045208 RepID=A0ABY4A967_9BURK|nr:hypothetical protein [Massilia violaceinigra]UOD30907.1 hypothetical protein INH39_04000 [Massilia violaceinigra]
MKKLLVFDVCSAPFWPAAAAMNALIDQEHFYYADCMATNSSRVMGYRIRNDKVEIDDAIVVDESDLTLIFENFSVKIGNSTYSGGEAASHGSCGFFCKRTGGLLDWIVMSTESNPFTSVEVNEDGVRFGTSSGLIWTVPNDNIGAIHIEKEELAASGLKRDAGSQATNDPGLWQDPDARVENAWQRLADNKNDGIENTFCHELFELNNFDEALFVSLCDDMGVVLDKHAGPKENYKLVAWIISCTFRCVFSHFDKADSYTITNFDDALARKWGAQYVDQLRDLLEKTVSAAVK